MNQSLEAVRNPLSIAARERDFPLPPTLSLQLQRFFGCKHEVYPAKPELYCPGSANRSRSRHFWTSLVKFLTGPLQGRSLHCRPKMYLHRQPLVFWTCSYHLRSRWRQNGTGVELNQISYSFASSVFWLLDQVSRTLCVLLCRILVLCRFHCNYFWVAERSRALDHSFQRKHRWNPGFWTSLMIYSTHLHCCSLSRQASQSSLVCWVRSKLLR